MYMTFPSLGPCNSRSLRDFARQYESQRASSKTQNISFVYETFMHMAKKDNAIHGATSLTRLSASQHEKQERRVCTGAMAGCTLHSSLPTGTGPAVFAAPGARHLSVQSCTVSRGHR